MSITEFKTAYYSLFASINENALLTYSGLQTLVSLIIPKSSDNFVLEDTVAGMVSNSKIANGDIVLVAENNSYYSISTSGEIVLGNGLKATRSTANIMSEDEVSEIIKSYRG
jgi:hypothetical protein